MDEHPKDHLSSSVRVSTVPTEERTHEPYCALQFGSTFAPIWPHREHTTPSPSNLIGVPSGKWPTLTIALCLQPSDLQYARSSRQPCDRMFPRVTGANFPRSIGGMLGVCTVVTSAATPPCEQSDV